MKKIMIIIPLAYVSSFGNMQPKQGTFKTEYFYINNPKVTEQRVKECQIMNEMTFAIERDCANAKIAFRRVNRKKATSDFIHQNFLK